MRRPACRPFAERTSTGLPPGVMVRPRRDMVHVAAREGSVLEVAADHADTETPVVAAVVDALRRGRGGALLVLSLALLAHFLGSQLTVTELIEIQAGARVLVLHPTVGRRAWPLQLL
jgi:hypothetical protein